MACLDCLGKIMSSLPYRPVLFNKTSPEPGQSGTDNLKEGRQFSTFSLILSHWVSQEICRVGIFWLSEGCRTTGWYQRKGLCFEIPTFCAARQCGLTMHSLSANNGKFQLNSPNLAPFLLLYSVSESSPKGVKLSDKNCANSEDLARYKASSSLDFCGGRQNFCCGNCVQNVPGMPHI